MKSFGPIKDSLSIENRYVRSVNIERDLDDPHALDGYLLTEQVCQALSRLINGLAATSTQRAWRLTGAYGGGKSALGLFLAAVLRQRPDRRSALGKLLDAQAPTVLAAARNLPDYEVVVITGARTDASIAVASALTDLLARRRATATQKKILSALASFVSARNTGEASANEVVRLLLDTNSYLASGAGARGGLLLLVDEMGRFLEYAADETTGIDASFFQALAEACGGAPKGAPLAVIGILHQRFEDYLEARRDRRAGVEWSKVAERFEDIAFLPSFEGTCQLMARAIKAEPDALRRSGVGKQVARLYADAERAGLLPAGVMTAVDRDSVYPFHPSALIAVTTLFRRFGQNERSALSFLLSSEPFALQDFVSRRDLVPGALYRVEDVCDWLLAQGGLRTVDNDRLKRWALMQDVLRSAPVFTTLEIRCLKTVGLLNLLEPQPGLSVSREAVCFAVADAFDDVETTKTLQKLVEKGLLYIRPATQEYCLWPQSSVDVAEELRRVRELSPPVTRLGSIIAQLPHARPVVAHRHYLESGTLRAALVDLVDSSEALRKGYEIPGHADGAIVVVPCYPGDDIKAIADRLKTLSADMPASVLVTLRRVSEEELDIATELLAWRQLERECEALRVDAYARNEVKQAIHRLTDSLTLRLADLRVPGQRHQSEEWYQGGKELSITDTRQLNRTLSEMFSAVYSASPRLRNELVNRASISTAAAAARQKLMERMFTHATVENLGIEQTPPEKAIYLSVLKNTGLHAQHGDHWAFVVPEADSSWHAAWTELGRLLDADGLLTVADVLAHFRKAPFGMRESVTILMFGAFLNVYRNTLILRERGTYLTAIESSHVARLIKRPESFEVHMARGRESVPELVAVYAGVFERSLGVTLVNPTVSEVTRTLFRWYLGLSEFVLNSTTLDQRHRASLALLGKAGDPIELLTVGLPLALGLTKSAQPYVVDTPAAAKKLGQTVEAFVRAAGTRLDVLRAELSRTLAEEVGVTDPAQVRPHVIAVAAAVEEGELVDYALRAFIQRTCDPARDERQWLDSLASLLGGRAIETWRDDTAMRFRLELRRVVVLLNRVIGLAKLTKRRAGADHAVVALHVVDQKGQERFVTVPADANGVHAGSDDRVAEIRAILDGLEVPSYVLARLLLDYSVRLPSTEMESLHD